jgi:hypothetical protein
MSAYSQINGNLYITGNLQVGDRLDLPPGTVRGAAIADNDNAAWTKFQQLHKKCYSQSESADVATARAIVHYFEKAGGVAYIRVIPDVVPTGGDKAFAIDVQRSVAGGAWTTILSATVAVSSSDVARTSKSATISLPTQVANTALAVIVTPSGSTGSQGRGVAVEVACYENATG